MNAFDRHFFVSWKGLFLFAAAVLLSSCGGIGSSKRDSLGASELPAEIAAQAPSIDLSALERAIHKEVNAERERHGLAPLDWSDVIASVARRHSQDMAQKGYFDHINGEGMNATQRAAAAGLNLSRRSGQNIFEGLGENIFTTHRYDEYVVSEQASGQKTYSMNWKSLDELVRESVDTWLNSPPHRANLLNPDYVHQGIGAALGANGTLFVTQNLN